MSFTHQQILKAASKDPKPKRISKMWKANRVAQKEKRNALDFFSLAKGGARARHSYLCPARTSDARTSASMVHTPYVLISLSRTHPSLHGAIVKIKCHCTCFFFVGRMGLGTPFGRGSCHAGQVVRIH